MENYQPTLDTAFRALADPTRRAAIARRIKGRASIKELAAPFDMGLPSFLKYVKALEAGGLISSDKAGRVRTCHLLSAQLIAVENWLNNQRTIWGGRRTARLHLPKNSTYRR